MEQKDVALGQLGQGDGEGRVAAAGSPIDSLARLTPCNRKKELLGESLLQGDDGHRGGPLAGLECMGFGRRSLRHAHFWEDATHDVSTLSLPAVTPSDRSLRGRLRFPNLEFDSLIRAWFEGSRRQMVFLRLFSLPDLGRTMLVH